MANVSKSGTPAKPWVVDYRVRIGGALKRKRAYFRTKREAQDYLHDVQAATKAGSYVDPKKAESVTVGQLYADWYERVTSIGARGRGPVKESTAANYRKNWTKHIEPRWSATPLANVRHADVEKWIATMPVGRGSESGANTRRRVGLLFGRIMGHAVRLGILAKNPAKDLAGGADYIPRARPEKRHVYMTIPELKAFAERCEPWGDMVLLAGTTGLRWGEITALRHGDIKGDGQPYIDVERAWSTDGRNIIASTTKTGEKRRVPVPRKVAEMVRRRRTESGLLFQARNSSQLHHSNFSARVLKPAGAGMDPAPTFHDLRHTAVSLAIHAGGNIKTVQRIAGHASAEMTLKTYSEVFEGDLHESAAALNELLD